MISRIFARLLSSGKLLLGGFCLFILTLLSSEAKVTLLGVTYYNLEEIACILKLKFHEMNDCEQALLYNRNVKLRFQKGKRYLTINNIQIWLGYPTLLYDNRLHITDIDLLKAITPILCPLESSCPPNLHCIVIDPGHGGRDLGTSNKLLNINEKDLTLDLSLRLKKELEKFGYKVILTRTNDHFIPLKERAAFANRNQADLFVSIHFNAVETGADIVEGIETYTLTLKDHPSTAARSIPDSDQGTFCGNNFDSWNAILGYSIQSNLLRDTGSVDRGLKRARFAVLKFIDCPGVLVEAGFLSNYKEAQKIKSSEYREQIARSIAKGILNYQKILNRAGTNNP